MSKTKTNRLRYFKNYRFNSLFFKNLYQMLLLILIPVVGATLLAYYAYTNIQENDIDAYCEKTATEVATQFNEILDNAYLELMYFGVSQDVEMFLLDGQKNQNFYDAENIMQLIRMPSLVKPYVKGVFIYAEDTGDIITSSGVVRYDMFEQRDLLEQCRENATEQKTFFVSSIHDSQKAGRAFLTVSSRIRFGRDTIGYAVMNMDRKVLIKEFAIPENMICYAVKDDSIWLTSDIEAYGKTATELGLRSSSLKNVHLYSSTDPKSGLEFIIKLDLTSYNGNLKNVFVIFSLILFIVIWLTVTFAVVISIRIYQPVEKILKIVQEEIPEQVGDNEQILAKDELEYILHSIEKTSHSQKSTIETLTERTHLLKKAQSVALQAQISPHFLNNTLETMNWTAMELLGSKNAVSEIAGALSLMLRMALESPDVLVPISREIEHCKSYLEIQKYRYEDRFDVIWDIAPDVLTYKTVKIVLQPLVENAIYHGIKPLSSKGVITIRGNLRDTYVELEVKDNGLGMTKEQIEELQNIMKKQEIRENRHIGIANVNQRIRLLFGEEYGVELESERGVGTKMTIRFPRVN